MSTAAAPAKMFPESDYEDGIYYPSSDDQPMAETGYHVNALMFLYLALDEFFRGRPDILLTANQFWYWQKGNPKARRAPDVMVVPGVGREPVRRSYRMWLEGNVRPAAIFEMSSRKTIKKDLGEKFAQYETLGVREYFLFDPEVKVLNPPLQGFRLYGGKYRPLRPRRGELTSALGFRLRKEELLLRVIDAQTGEVVPTEGELAERERRRADEAVAELERIREQLRRLSGGQS